MDSQLEHGTLPGQKISEKSSTTPIARACCVRPVLRYPRRCTTQYQLRASEVSPVVQHTPSRTENSPGVRTSFPETASRRRRSAFCVHTFPVSSPSYPRSPLSAQHTRAPFAHLALDDVPRVLSPPTSCVHEGLVEEYITRSPRPLSLSNHNHFDSNSPPLQLSQLQPLSPRLNSKINKMSTNQQEEPTVYYYCSDCGSAVYVDYAQGRDKGDLCIVCESFLFRVKDEADNQAFTRPRTTSPPMRRTRRRRSRLRCGIPPRPAARLRKTLPRVNHQEQHHSFMYIYRVV